MSMSIFLIDLSWACDQTLGKLLIRNPIMRIFGSNAFGVTSGVQINNTHGTYLLAFSCCILRILFLTKTRQWQAWPTSILLPL
jgi:hypothetical protein